MGLVNMTTNLKSLRFGKDVIGGGSTNQPYVTTPIPKDIDDVGRTGGPDFLLRGGTLLPRLIAKDVSRLTQMLFDFKSPNGPLFIAKQNVLSLINVNSEAGFAKPAKLIMNQGVYTPLEAIIQAGTNAIGMHVPKQGYNPFDNLNPDGPKNFGFESSRNLPLAFPTYLRTISKDRLDSKGFGRLDNLANTKIYALDASGELDLLEYTGGPGSTLGVGKTIIPISLESKTVFKATDLNNFGTGIKNLYKRSSLTYNELFQIESVGQGGSLFSGIGENREMTNFQKILAPTGSEAIPNTIAWSVNKQIETRVNLGDPGKRGNLSSYTIGKRLPGKNSDPARNSVTGNSSYRFATDKINAFPLYKSSKVTSDDTKNDLVKFRIGVIDNKNPNEKTYVHFRAFINSLNDSYTSEWSAQKFMGRSEDFYTYGGFGRTVSLDWTVAAQSKQELIPMYQKLNYLASVCAGDYSDVGYMRGNLITLSVGGWFQEQVGIMTGLSLEVPQDSPWEIGITDAGNLTQLNNSEINSDPSVQEMPMIVNVSGFNFIPIHDFVPRVQKNKFNGGNVEGGGKFISQYGKERYINLKGGLGSNYNGGPGNSNLDNGSLNYMPKKSGV